MSQPTVTILTPSYNHEQFVIESLESIKNQTYANIQHIIIDDCSKDNSVSVIKNWIEENDYKCTFIQHETNQGICKTLNESLKLAEGKYWCGCSSDDVFLPEKIELLVAAMESGGEKVAFGHGRFNVFNENSEIIQENVKEIKPRLSDDDFINVLTSGLDVHSLTALYRVSSLEKIGWYNENLGFEDVDIFLRLMNAGYTHIRLEDTLATYRKIEGGNSVSDQHRKNYHISQDFIKMNEHHYGDNEERNRVNKAVLQDAQFVYELAYNDKRTPLLSNRIQTIWTPFILKLLREKRLFFHYMAYSISLSMVKKYSPYSLRDSWYFIKTYFRKDQHYL